MHLTIQFILLVLSVFIFKMWFALFLPFFRLFFLASLLAWAHFVFLVWIYNYCFFLYIRRSHQCFITFPLYCRSFWSVVMWIRWMTFALCEYAILFYAKCLCHAKFVQGRVCTECMFAQKKNKGSLMRIPWIP